MKRILSVLISGVMLAVSCLTAMPVSAKEEYTEYIVPFYSDQTKQKQVVGISNESMLKDGEVLIPLETACEIAGASIAAESDEAVVITRNYVSWCCEYKDEKNQYLLIDSNTGKGNFYKSALKCLTESSWSGTSFKYSLDDEGLINLPVDSFNQTEIIYEYHNNELYVSFYDFLVMMGVNVKVANKATQAELVKPFFNSIGIPVDDNSIDELINYIYWQVMGDCDADIFFSCRLGTPIDKLYMDYYETQSEEYMCDLTDYYTDGDVKWANLVNSAASFNGLTETALAAMNMNTDYSEALVNVVSNIGGNLKNSEDSEASLQDIAFLLQYGWDSESLSLSLIENMEDIAGIVSNAQGSKFTGIDLGISDGISIAFGAYTTGLEYYDKYNALDTLFENDKNLLKNSILNSEHMKQAASDEYGDDFFSKLGNFLGRGAVINKDLLNTSNSYINLYRSAVEVQSLIETSAPATWGAIQKAYKGAASATLDTVILKTIDGFAFSGVPVTELAVQFVQLLSKSISKTAYVEQKSKIAEFDDYIFIQEVAKSCFDDYSLDSENAFSTFVLGIKASMTAYEAENEQNKSKKIQGRLECLEKMLSDATFANRNFYRIGAKGCVDLTEMLSNNTDISKLDTTPRQDITLEFGVETNETTKSETIDYEEIYYSYIENELIPKYGLASLEQFEIDQNEKNGMPNTSFGIVSADIDDYDDDNTKELIVLTLEPSEKEKFYCDINLHLYSIEDNKVKYADSEYLYGYQMYDIHSDNFFTLDKCNNELLFTNNVCYFSGEAASSIVTIIKIVNSNFVSENMTTSDDYEGEKLYVNGNEVCNSNDDINFYETAQRIISQKLIENGFLFDNVEYKGRSINISVTNNTKIAKYSATFDSSSANWFSVIIPSDYTDLRDHITVHHPNNSDQSIAEHYADVVLANYDLYADMLTPGVFSPMIQPEIGEISFFDIDLDGELELFIHRYEDGTARTTSCRVYKVIDDTLVLVEKFDHNFVNSIDGIYQNKNGEKFYLCYDSAGGFGGTSSSLVKLNFLHEQMQITEIYNRIDWNAPASGDLYGTIEYYENGNLIKCNENEYETKISNFKDSLINLNLQYDASSAFNGMSVEEKREFLINSFNAFSYDGYQRKTTNTGISTDWQQLYANELRNYMNSNGYIEDDMFDLYDINIDGIPELFISTGIAHMEQCKIYTIWEHKLKDLNSSTEYGEYGEVQCSNDNKTLLSSYYTYGHGYLSYYQIQNGELVCVLSTYCDAADVGLENATYKVNNIIVTKEEYSSKCAEYDAEYVAVGRKYSLDESTINSVLLSSGTRMGTIITENDALNVRQSPSTESTKIGTVDKGSTVIIHSEVDGWYEIEFNGKSGYVLGEYVQIVE